MTDLYTKLRNAIDERLMLAQLAESWPSIIGIVEGDPPFVAPDQIIEFIAANNPVFVIRACQVDLERLERHATTDYGTCCVCIAECEPDQDSPDGYWYRLEPQPCPEVRLLARVYEVDL